MWLQCCGAGRAGTFCSKSEPVWRSGSGYTLDKTKKFWMIFSLFVPTMITCLIKSNEFLLVRKLVVRKKLKWLKAYFLYELESAKKIPGAGQKRTGFAALGVVVSKSVFLSLDRLFQVRIPARGLLKGRQIALLILSNKVLKFKNLRPRCAKKMIFQTVLLLFWTKKHPSIHEYP